MRHIHIRETMRRSALAVGVLAISVLAFSPAATLAEPLGFAAPLRAAHPAEDIFDQDQPARVSPEMAPALRRSVVGYATREAPGTIIIDTPNTYLYLVLGGGRAIRYGIGVGRDGFTWSGVRTVERKTEWPDWMPPAEMLDRQPYLPRLMAGGPGNPLGARAMYLSGTLYRIHGTNDPSTIGKRVSSGCIRLVNEDVIDLYSRVGVGTKVVVLPMNSTPSGRIEYQSISSVERGTRSTLVSVSRPHGLY
jgi:lipoprotein-anchoring transpeptidase ErfK/SrfK